MFQCTHFMSVIAKYFCWEKFKISNNKNNVMKTTENNLSLAVVPQDFLKQMETDISELKSILLDKSDKEINGRWIESVKVPKILGISKKTWQTYRDKRMIPFSQIGSKIYVKQADLENFLNSYKINVKK